MPNRPYVYSFFIEKTINLTQSHGKAKMNSLGRAQIHSLELAICVRFTIAFCAYMLFCVDFVGPPITDKPRKSRMSWEEDVKR